MKKLLWAAASVAAMGLAGCGGGAKQANTTGGNNSTAAAPAPAASPAGNSAAGNSAAGSGNSAAGSANQNLIVLNKTGLTITMLQIAPTSQTDWGEDIMGRDVLPNGESAEVEFERAADECMWDIRVTYADNAVEEYDRVDVCKTRNFTLTPDEVLEN